MKNNKKSGYADFEQLNTVSPVTSPTRAA